MRDYANAIARAARRHAVWEPGSSVKVGDFGYVQGGCFVRLGSVATEFGIDIQAEAKREKFFRLRAVGAEHGSVDASAEIFAGTASGSVTWTGGRGLYLAAKAGSLNTIHNLWAAANEIRQSVRAWRWKWKLVREVQCLEGGLILLGNESTTAGQVSLDAAPQTADLAALAAHGTADSAGGFSIRRYPIDGAVYVDLVRVKTWLPFGALPMDDEPCEPFPATEDLEDDNLSGDEDLAKP